MITIIVFLGGLSFILFPVIVRRRGVSFVDYYLLFCLYYDIMNTFTNTEGGSFLFSQQILFTSYGLYYIYANYQSILKIEKKILSTSLVFLGVVLFGSIYQGLTLKLSVLSFTSFFSSMAMLPIAYHHYATKGRIENLLRSVFLFTIILVSVIIIFTIFKVDSKYYGSSDTLWQSSSSPGGILYFGNLGLRGGFTYIGFLVLLFPILFYQKNIPKYMLYLVLIFLLLVMVLSFKRFAFFTVLFGFLTYMFSNLTSRNLKFLLLIGSLSIFTILILFTNVSDIAGARYKERGGDQFVGIEGIENDIRFFEIFIVYEEIQNSFESLLFGKQAGRHISIGSMGFSKDTWGVHSTYANFLLNYGFVGLISYLLIFYYLYKIVRKKYKLLIKKAKNNSILIKSYAHYWLLFRTLFLVFLFAGMVGGTVKITIGGLVFIVLGAIGGHIYKQSRNIIATDSM